MAIYKSAASFAASFQMASDDDDDEVFVKEIYRIMEPSCSQQGGGGQTFSKHDNNNNNNMEDKLFDFEIPHQDQFEWDIVFPLRFEWWIQQKLDQLRCRESTFDFNIALQRDNPSCLLWDEDQITQIKASHDEFKAYVWIAWALLVESVMKCKDPACYNEVHDAVERVDLVLVQHIVEAIPFETVWKAWYQVIFLMAGDMSVDYVNRNLELQEYAFKYVSTQDKSFEKEDLRNRILANTLMNTNRFSWASFVRGSKENIKDFLHYENVCTYKSAEDMSKDSMFIRQVFDMSHEPTFYVKRVKAQAKKAYQNGSALMCIRQNYDPMEWDIPIGK